MKAAAITAPPSRIPGHIVYFDQSFLMQGICNYMSPGDLNFSCANDVDWNLSKACCIQEILVLLRFDFVTAGV